MATRNSRPFGENSTEQLFRMQDVSVPGCFVQMIREKQMNAVEALIIGMVWTHQKTHGEGLWDTNEELAKSCGVTQLTLKKYLKRMVELHWLERQVHHKPHVHRVLTLNMDGIRKTLKMDLNARRLS